MQRHLSTWSLLLAFVACCTFTATAQAGEEPPIDLEGHWPIIELPHWPIIHGLPDDPRTNEDDDDENATAQRHSIYKSIFVEWITDIETPDKMGIDIDGIPPGIGDFGDISDSISGDDSSRIVISSGGAIPAPGGLGLIALATAACGGRRRRRH
ncbi:MAG: hypothetical protein AAF432_09585 [Planctomycetota bacterium]